MRGGQSHVRGSRTAGHCRVQARPQGRSVHRPAGVASQVVAAAEPTGRQAGQDATTVRADIVRPPRVRPPVQPVGRAAPAVHVHRTGGAGSRPAPVQGAQDGRIPVDARPVRAALSQVVYVRTGVLRRWAQGAEHQRVYTQGESQERPAGFERREQQPGPVDHQLHVEPQGHTDHGDGRAQGTAVDRRRVRLAQLPVRGGVAVAAAGGLGGRGRVGGRSGCLDGAVRHGGGWQRDQLDVGCRRRPGKPAQGRPSPRRLQTSSAASGCAGGTPEDGPAIQGCHKDALPGRCQRRVGWRQAKDFRPVRDTQGRHRSRTAHIQGKSFSGWFVVHN